MKLTKTQVQNYRSVEDSGEFSIGDLTCLVGQNESGKTALLSALRGLNPSQPFEFDEVIDYPRRFATRFDERHPAGSAEVVRTWWTLDEADMGVVAERFGPDALISNEVEIHFGFRYADDKRLWVVKVDEGAALRHLASLHGLSATERNVLHGAKDGPAAVRLLAGLSERTPKQDAFMSDIKKLRESRITLSVIDLISKRQPKFFYTSHFERMSGEVSIEQLKKDRAAGNVSVGDSIFLDFLEYAGTSLEELLDASRREELNAKCEAASNEITEEIFQFWSQNSALEVAIVIDSGRPNDPPPFNAGTVADIRIRNTNHKATLPLSERSAGFVWFFSFLAQFKQLKKTSGNQNAILLLDEPGLTLHGKAQGDLLRYFIERLIPDHQVIYSTHSPFMVPMDRLMDIRIVEDVVLTDAETRPRILGTKVRTDVLEVAEDTLFPLQGALGYEVTQSLFIGANTLLVEGPSDILYLQVVSDALKRRGREGLSPKWTVCPSGGIDKIAPFVRLFIGNKIRVAVLSDIAKGDKSKLDRLEKSDILKAGHLHTCAEFCNQDEADVEDLFHPDLLVKMLNGAYSPPDSHTVTLEALMSADTTTNRLTKQAEALFRTMPPRVAEYGHYAAARWLLENPSALDGESTEVLETLERFEAVAQTFNGLLRS